MAGKKSGGVIDKLFDGIKAALSRGGRVPSTVQSGRIASQRGIDGALAAKASVGAAPAPVSSSSQGKGDGKKNKMLAWLRKGSKPDLVAKADRQNLNRHDVDLQVMKAEKQGTEGGFSRLTGGVSPREFISNRLKSFQSTLLGEHDGAQHALALRHDGGLPEQFSFNKDGQMAGLNDGWQEFMGGKHRPVSLALAATGKQGAQAVRPRTGSTPPMVVAGDGVLHATPNPASAPPIPIKTQPGPAHDLSTGIKTKLSAIAAAEKSEQQQRAPMLADRIHWAKQQDASEHGRQRQKAGAQQPQLSLDMDGLVA